MDSEKLYLPACGIVTPIGSGKASVAQALFNPSTDGIVCEKILTDGRKVLAGAVSAPLPQIPPELAAHNSRNNRLMLLALQEIAQDVAAARQRYGRDRIAIVLGSSTSGIDNGEDAFEARVKDGVWPAAFDYRQQELTSLAEFTASIFDLTGPAYTIATACSSSAKVFASARRLIRAGLADAAIVGGADSLCRMTLNGFASLELVSQGHCLPFSKNRDGINIGEGAAVFLLTPEPADIALLGVGETADAHHMTAPEPCGVWATAAMQQALTMAGLTADDIAYVNLHGTGTGLNDAMEANAVSALFGDRVPCSSTKGMTGHMLGATGGCEAAFLWLSLSAAFNREGQLPPHRWDGVADPALPALRFVTPVMRFDRQGRVAMLSNSFGFGGSNAAVILGRETV